MKNNDYSHCDYHYFSMEWISQGNETFSLLQAPFAIDICIMFRAGGPFDF